MNSTQQIQSSSSFEEIPTSPIDTMPSFPETPASPRPKRRVLDRSRFTARDIERMSIPDLQPQHPAAALNKAHPSFSKLLVMQDCLLHSSHARSA